MKGKKVTSIGIPVPHIRGTEIVTGALKYITDLKIPGMLYGRVLRSPIAHGKILDIHTEKAERVSGVKLILTGRNSPSRKFGSLLEDWELLATDRVRFAGDEVAIVAATDPDAAREAINCIRMDLQELPAVLDPNEAMEPGAPLIHDKPRNIASEYHFALGDVESAYREADFIYENCFSSPQIFHAYLEMNGCLACPEVDGKLTLYLPTQTPSVTRMMYARALDLPIRKLRLVIPPYGGAFGGKQLSKLHILAGYLALRTGKPVKMTTDREEDFFSGNPKVHLYIDVKISAKKNGTLLSKEVRVVGGAGGRVVYAPIVTSTACSRVDSLYRFKHLKTSGYTVYTNTTPTAAFRGFGHPESLLAVETSIDMVARGLGIDPVEIRLKNVYGPGDTTPHGWRITSCGIAECIEKAVDASGFREKLKNRKPNRGIGIACCNHVSGNRLLFRDFDGSAALLKLGWDGDITLVHGESDMGQGQDTILSQIAAEVLGINPGDIRIESVDTDVSPFGLGCVSSRGTLFAGNAVKNAAMDARLQILDAAARLLEADAEDLCLEKGEVFVKGSPAVSIPLRKIVQTLSGQKGGMPVMGQGFYVPKTELPDPVTKLGNISPAYPFGCHIAEVEVDTDTGAVSVLRYTAAHDIGRVINPQLARGQVHGGVAQGIGFALMEEILFEKGRIANPNFLDYILPGPSDLPPIKVIFVETHDKEGPFGAKGIGEPALDPVPAAIANAIFDAVGVRVTRLPCTAERLRAALQAGRGSIPKRFGSDILWK